MTETLVLIAHGSRHAAAATAHQELCLALSDRLGRPVVAAYLEIQQPTVDDALRAALANGGRAVVVPHFIHPGGHTNNDIPAAIDRVCAETGSPSNRVRLLDPTGTQPAIVDLVAAVFSDAIGCAGSGEPTA